MATPRRAGAGDAVAARVLLPVTAAAACGAGLAAGRLASSGHAVLIVGLAGVLVPVLLWRWPHAGAVLLFALATVVEQFRYSAGTHPGVITSRIPLFQSVTKGSGISLFELVLGLVVVVWLMKGALEHSWNAPRSPVSRAMVGFLCLIVVGIGVGMSHGGKSQIILYEVRPWIYLATAYLLAASLLRTISALRALMWTFVLGVGFKAIQGLFMYLAVRHDSPRPEVILAHEESFFFGLFLILCLGLWLFGIRGRLRTVATVLVPAVLQADMANARRTAWAIIGATLIVFFALAYSSLPERRPALRRVLVVMLAISAVYFPLFWNNVGTFGQPARALHSQVAPDARDLSSNLYRVQENANLAFNIRQTHSLGKGFGPLIVYALPIVDISKIDAFITFLPHNGVLDMWMRLGILGIVVFLFLLAAIIIRACKLLRTGDRELALLGALTVCAVVAYVVQGFSDLGFFWFRVALCLGTLVGAMESAHRLLEAAEHSPAGAQ